MSRRRVNRASPTCHGKPLDEDSWFLVFMSEYLMRICTKEGKIRGLACVTTNPVEDARRRHNTFPTARVALGRALTVGALLSALLRTGQQVTLTSKGKTR